MCLVRTVREQFDSHVCTGLNNSSLLKVMIFPCLLLELLSQPDHLCRLSILPPVFFELASIRSWFTNFLVPSTKASTFSYKLCETKSVFCKCSYSIVSYATFLEKCSLKKWRILLDPYISSGKFCFSYFLFAC